MTQLRDQLQATLTGSYTLERELGGGGMSRVFVAEELRLNRKVVVKVLSPELAQGISIERFDREIQTVAGLQQANIVPVHTAGDTNGLPYYTMPFVEGESLRVRLGRGPLAVAEVVGILRDVSKALAYAHRHGVVHRDIKPDNVLLSGGTAVVTDFGIAKAISVARTHATGATLTQIGTSIGTPAYMAPEQAAGDPEIDHRADIYSLGAMAYELLSGQVVFSNRTPQRVLAAHMSEAPKPIEELRQDLPAGLVEIVMQCLAKDPAQRPQSAVEIVRSLDVIGTTAEGRSFTPRRRKVARLQVVVGAVVLAATALGAWLIGRVRTTPTSDTSVIAVMPFVNSSGDPKDEYFSDGITDELAQALSRLPKLRVVGRGTSFAFKGRSLGAQAIGKQLNVPSIIEGTVRRAGDRLRITVQLTSTSTGQSLWSDSYESSSGDVFRVQDEVTGAVAIKVAALHGIGSSGAATMRRGTADGPAYDHYLQGRFWLAQRTPDGLKRAVTSFREALAIDPRFARAFAGLGMVYIVIGTWDETDLSRGQADAEALANAKRALAIDSTIADAYMILGSNAYKDYDFEESGKWFRRAIQIEPNNATAHQWFSLAYRAEGRLDDGLREIRIAQSLDPLAKVMVLNELQNLNLMGDFQSARRTAARLLSMDSTYYYGYMFLSVAHLFLGHADSALRDVEVAAPLPHAVSGTLGRQVMALAALGRWADAERIRQRIERRADPLISDLDVLLAAVAFDDKTKAMEALTRAVDPSARSHIVSWFGSPSCDPSLASLRNDPRYIALMDRYRMKICNNQVRWPIKSRPSS